MRGGAYGMGGRTKMAHVHKAWYGPPQVPKCLHQHLMASLLDPEKLGAELFIHDRNAFGWECRGHRFIGGVHVNDVLFAVTPLEFGDKFMKRLKAGFWVASGEKGASEFRGLEIERDWSACTVALKQGALARRLIDKCDMWGARTEPTPFRVGWDKPLLFDGAEDAGTSFDYALCLGDLAVFTH